MITRIISGLLLVFAVIMAGKQGWSMLTGKQEMMEMFGKWGFSKTTLVINGVITLLSGLLLIFPKTFFLGNFLMAAGILLIICFHLLNHDIKGAFIEIPFLMINLVLVFLHHPLSKV